jgi:DNA-directed RNA polymerase specialized sigma24 family protein
MNVPWRGEDAGFVQDEFEAFFTDAEPRLRRALIAMLGAQRGREATAEALSYAWENWDDVRQLTHPTAYLLRVGRSRTRPRKIRSIFARPDEPDPWFEPALGRVLGELSPRQRLAVVLVHGFGWTIREVAEFTDTKITTVQNHLERGLARLRSGLEVTPHE